MTPTDIRQIRAKLGFTQEQLAKACNTDRGTVLKWESHNSQQNRTPSGSAVRLLQLLSDLYDSRQFSRYMKKYL